MDRALSYVLRRLLVLVIGIFVILTAEFIIFRVLPDDPVSWVLPRDPNGDYSGLGDQVLDMFDEPLYAQYFEFVRDMLTGEFYYSHVLNTDVGDRILTLTWNTLTLFLPSLLLFMVLGPLIGHAISRMKAHLSRQVVSLAPLALFSVSVIGVEWVFLRYFAFEWGLLSMTSDGNLASVACAVTAIFLASVGAIILAVRDGQTRASAASAPDAPRLRDGMFAAMPNLQFMVAGSMMFTITAEVLFVHPGLGYYFIFSLFNMDYFLLQATFFLLTVIVFLTNYMIETVVTLIRPRRRLDLYLREDEARRETAGTTYEEIRPNTPKVGGAVSALAGTARDYVRSPVGVVSLAVLLGFVVLAIAGPALSSTDEMAPWIVPSPTDMFLDGATGLIAVSFIVGLLASCVGMAIGVVAGLARPYADGIVAGVMHGLMAIPIACLIIIPMFSERYDCGYLDVALAFSMPVIALITLLVCHGFVSSRRRAAPVAGGSASGVPLVHSVPAVVSWTLSGLKYGIPMTVIAVFICDFLNFTRFDSWGFAFDTAVWNSMQVTNEWNYILPPLLGMFFLVGSMFLVMDTLERVVRTRFSGLV